MVGLAKNKVAMDSQDDILLPAKETTPAAAGAKASAAKKKRLLVIGAVVIAVLIVIGTVLGVLASQNVIGKSTNTSAKLAGSSGTDLAINSNQTSTSTTSSPEATESSLESSDEDSTDLDDDKNSTSCSRIRNIPDDIMGTYMDMTTWLDTTDFNCTWTNATVGGLSIAGLNSTWSDAARANDQVPALDTDWGSYLERPARGVNIGGWLSLEPFITPSLFDYPESEGVVDEYNLMKHLGDNASAVLEQHYSTFITEADFAAIAAAGLDHVRIPFSYWAVTTYEGDPYLEGVSWRYLLRGIEWARKHGLRVNLDLHALPGSQNGWNHSGRAGNINWLLNGTETAMTNRQRSLDINKQLATFFAQDRYKNIIVFYGLANEPGPSIPTDDLVSWTKEAYDTVSQAGYAGTQVFSDGIRGVSAWNGLFEGYGDSLSIDTHLYAIFVDGLLKMKRYTKVKFACDTWGQASVDAISDFGPTLVGEWSVADNDCTPNLNGVNVGARWDGSFGPNNGAQWCPTENESCTCAKINGKVEDYSDNYKTFLYTFAVAQMDAFEKTWGWFYWTWKTESAPLFSYKAGIEHGFLPKIAYERSWDCSKEVPSFGDAEYE
ncbi:uncharacterized protein BROUX77_004401 [Berkeleyomyces rouxiae]|uniref:uncharacterized protein n=1 Tax=Berkeleyomyces rouxiae TaxID=2035830 RepID=UPI003B823208